MNLNAATLRRLAALRLRPDAMAEVLSIIADIQASDEARKSKDRARKIRGKSTEIPVENPGKKRVPNGPPDEYISNPPLTPQKISSLRSDNRRTALEALETCLSEKAAREVLDHRKALRKRLTPRAAELLAKAFLDFGEPERAAEAMIANAWQGFKPEWMAHGARAGPAGRSNGTEGFLANVGKMMETERRKDAEQQGFGDGCPKQAVLGFPAGKRE